MTGRAIKSDIEKFQPTPFAGMEWREKNANRLAIRIDRNLGFSLSVSLLFVLFTNAMTNIAQLEYVTINDKSLDGVLGNQTRSGRMEGTDKSTKSTELWRHPYVFRLNRGLSTN